jgi:plasmid stabilization system protein ParE
VTETYKVYLTRHAQDDLASIYDYIAADNPKNAVDFVFQLEAKVFSLNAFPERHPRIPENEFFGTDYRHLIYKKYRIIYRVFNGSVFILRIIHGAKMLQV